MKRFICIQTGARRNYAVPSIFERAGMLEAFYTDLCADAGLGAWCDRRRHRVNETGVWGEQEAIAPSVSNLTR